MRIYIFIITVYYIFSLSYFAVTACRAYEELDEMKKKHYENQNEVQHRG